LEGKIGVAGVREEDLSDEYKDKHKLVLRGQYFVTPLFGVSRLRGI